MKNLIEYFKDKIYYVMAITIIIIILLVVISSCSGRKTYGSIEQVMVNAAKEYYNNNKNKLPKEENGTVKVTTGSLIEAELLDEIKDPQDSGNICSGYVEVTKVGKEYSYIPFLVCKGNYEPKYLTDIVKKAKTDEYGNGVYSIGDELVYRGKDVKNYVEFNNQLWRIVKVDSEGDIKLVKANFTNETVAWDNSYNGERDSDYGITTSYLQTNIRKYLADYYKSNFDKDSKAKIVAKTLCVGGYDIPEDYNETWDAFDVQKECSVVKENEKIGLLSASDFKNASLDENCKNLNSKECGNRNYLSNNEEIYTWLINRRSNNSYDVLYIDNTIDFSYASNEKRINPVIYISSKSITINGKGTLKNPYNIK